MNETLDWFAPGREVASDHRHLIKVAGRCVRGPGVRLDQRFVARVDARALDEMVARVSDDYPSVSHPHGEASRPGAWRLRTDTKPTRIGGTHSGTINAFAFAFVFVFGNRGEADHGLESENGSEMFTGVRRSDGAC